MNSDHRPGFPWDLVLLALATGVAVVGIHALLGLDGSGFKALRAYLTEEADDE